MSVHFLGGRSPAEMKRNQKNQTKSSQTNKIYPFNYFWNRVFGYGTSCLEMVEDNTIFTDPRDSQTYKIVVIGTQTWFAEIARL